MFKRYKIRSYEMGLLFRDGELRGLVPPGTHWYVDPLCNVHVDIVSQRDPWLIHEKLDLFVKSGVLKDHAVVLDLKDHERAMVWIENRFSHVLPAGLFAYWTGQKNVRVEVIDARNVRLEHDEMKDPMNKVTEARARKAAEANLISRREETAAMRSQANTAKLFVDNTVLMRLRELEVLEKIAAADKLNIILGERNPGEKGLADKVVNLL